MLCIELSEDHVDEILLGSPNKMKIDWEQGSLVCDYGDRSGTANKDWRQPNYQFTLSEYQKEQIAAGGSVNVMLKLAAELQAEGKL